MTPMSASPIAPRDPGRANWFLRSLRKVALSNLAALTHGCLIIDDPLGRTAVGDDPSLTVRMTIHDLGVYRQLAMHGSVGVAEAYGDGGWDCDDLVGLIQLLVRNRVMLDDMESGLARFGGWALRRWHAGRRNTRAGSQRNIVAHYDLGNDFFKLFLSEDLMYSSAMWTEEDDTLDRASRRKLDTVCRKLRLTATDHVVEIGTGWGGFAMHAAKHYGCRVTTATISPAQHAQAVERVRAAGLQDQIEVLLCDYRDLPGRYDKLVSIEMIEAIGASYLDTFFSKVASLLRPDGLALIQAITIEDHRYEKALASVDFIKRHIFPGSFIPSIEAMLKSKSRVTDMSLVHLEDFGESYARTLNAWRHRFLDRIDDVHAQGFDARFCRLWAFYFAYCEGGFLERSIGVSQLLMARPDARTLNQSWVPTHAS